MSRAAEPAVGRVATWAGRIVVGLTLLASPGVAQSVEGTVKTSDGDRPLAYARVEVVDASVSDWTDEEGVYRLSGLAPGEWRVRVVHPGHDSLELGMFVPGDRVVQVDITLRAHPGPEVDALAEFEPFEVRHTLPALLNVGEVSRLMQRLYPPELAEDRIGGEAVLMIWLDEAGQVARSRISSSSGDPALDSVALAVSDSMRFRPARSQEQGVRVYVRIPVLFTVPDSTPPERPTSPSGRRR